MFKGGRGRGHSGVFSFSLAGIIMTINTPLLTAKRDNRGVVRTLNTSVAIFPS